MKDIYDALNHVSMDLNEYAPVPLEAGESERQVSRLLAAEKKERPALRVHRRRWTVLAAAAALTACLAVGAGAAHAWSADFAAFLGLGEEDSLGDMSLGLGLSQTLPGGTVTLEGVLGDDYCIYVPFTVEAPEGQVLDGTLDYGFDNCTLYSDASDGMVQHMEMLPDDDPADNKLRFVMMASSSKPLRGKMAEATVWNLFSYPTDTSRLHDEDAVVPGGKIFVDSTLIGRKVQRTDVTTYYIPATQMASDNQMPTLANMIIMGKVLKECPSLGSGHIQEALKKVVSARHQDLLAVNEKALQLGHDYEG